MNRNAHRRPPRLKRWVSLIAPAVLTACGGGGGGYSGGAGGGGGGTSYLDSAVTQTIALSGVRSGNGQVVIALAPEINGSALKQGILLLFSLFCLARYGKGSGVGG